MPADVVTVATGAGMLALWRGSAFADLNDYPAWESRVTDRLTSAIESGELVPIGIQSDGTFGVRVAIAPDTPSNRERTYAVATSDPYLFVADGGPVYLSGLEDVGDSSSSPLTLSLPEGRYAVRATIVAWDEEPGGKGPDGSPTPHALPDFLVTIEPSTENQRFRISEETFDPPN